MKGAERGFSAVEPAGDPGLLRTLWDADPTKAPTTLRQKLADGKKQENRAIVTELGRIDVDIQPFLPMLLEALGTGKDKWYRAQAADTLSKGGIGRTTKQGETHAVAKNVFNGGWAVRPVHGPESLVRRARHRAR